ncbi:uncharacterized protein V1518DRAFT_405484 [Limtongia smithiae]|uniref:uncharacterized protein n=1 Tax=Limtongia smithiae TaxID=1125753 RepID=UPI0034CEF775
MVGPGKRSFRYAAAGYRTSRRWVGARDKRLIEFAGYRHNSHEQCWRYKADAVESECDTMPRGCEARYEANGQDHSSSGCLLDEQQPKESAGREYQPRRRPGLGSLAREEAFMILSWVPHPYIFSLRQVSREWNATVCEYIHSSRAGYEDRLALDYRCTPAQSVTYFTLGASLMRYWHFIDPVLARQKLQGEPSASGGGGVCGTGDLCSSVSSSKYLRFVTTEYAGGVALRPPRSLRLVETLVVLKLHMRQFSEMIRTTIGPLAGNHRGGGGGGGGGGFVALVFVALEELHCTYDAGEPAGLYGAADFVSTSGIYTLAPRLFANVKTFTLGCTSGTELRRTCKIGPDAGMPTVSTGFMYRLLLWMSSARRVLVSGVVFAESARPAMCISEAVEEFVLAQCWVRAPLLVAVVGVLTRNDGSHFRGKDSVLLNAAGQQGTPVLLERAVFRKVVEQQAEYTVSIARLVQAGDEIATTPLVL